MRDGVETWPSADKPPRLVELKLSWKEETENQQTNAMVLRVTLEMALQGDDVAAETRRMRRRMSGEGLPQPRAGKQVWRPSVPQRSLDNPIPGHPLELLLRTQNDWVFIKLSLERWGFSASFLPMRGPGLLLSGSCSGQLCAFLGQSPNLSVFLFPSS